MCVCVCVCKRERNMKSDSNIQDEYKQDTTIYMYENDIMKPTIELVRVHRG